MLKKVMVLWHPEGEPRETEAFTLPDRSPDALYAKAGDGTTWRLSRPWGDIGEDVDPKDAGLRSPVLQIAPR